MMDVVSTKERGVTTPRTATLTTWLLTNVGASGGIESAGNLIGGDGAPKLKFLFTVEFQFRNPLGVDRGSELLGEIKYDLKTATRPNISVNREDVNFYNYRTKVATRINYGTVKLTFYEDSLNTANDLLWNYISHISPIANVGKGDNPAIGAMGVSTAGEEVSIGQKASGIGPMDSPDGPIAWMRVHHHYVEYTGPRPTSRNIATNGSAPQEGGARGKITTYTYMNPKIESIDIDELDMSSSDASTISVTFTVDSVSVEHRDYA